MSNEEQLRNDGKSLSSGLWTMEPTLAGAKMLAAADEIAQLKSIANKAFEQAAKWCAQKRDETFRDFNAATDNNAAQPLYAASVAYSLAYEAIVAMKGRGE
jgi:hypothetical protein